jgi:predicted DCC family thiol-disulfide oxidoreductase YuxK
MQTRSIVKRTVFYDGLCQLCSREIDLFRKLVKDGRLDYVDISSPNFVAADHGVDAMQVHRHMHVRNDETGEMLVGVPALAAMWEVVPWFGWLAWLSRLPVLRWFAKLGYAVFAWIRPKLPKRTCANDYCATK